MTPTQKLTIPVITVFLTALDAAPPAELPTDEPAIIALFEAAGSRITTDADGRATKIFSSGSPPHTTEELQLLGKLTQLREIALNAPEAGDDDWAFLHDLKNLRRLTIWHCHSITSLAPFCDLPIEALTVGGCMGIRDLNRGHPERQRDAVLSLKNLPNLTYLNLYHSPLLPDDAHIAHIATQFPKLVEIKTDFAAPRRSKTNITPEGLAKLQALPIKVLHLENIQSLTPAHMHALGGIRTLEALLIDNRRNSFDATPLVAALKSVRPDLEINVAGEGAKDPPRRSRDR